MIGVIGDIISVGSLGMITGVLATTDTTIETAIYAILAGDGAISSLVSTRIYPNLVPQGKAMPALTYQQITGVRDESCDGPSGLVAARFQINCWAENYADARELADVVRKELDGYSGTVNSREIEVIMLEDEGDMPQIMPGVDVIKRHGKRLDFIVWFHEELT